ncbi:glycosyltransferase family 2 protein [Vreelandella sulfidaeris]|uniref:glycosyltransferase family 2 protein n=1 Tax=Vreelandella sulfidaeris TaxID=115553 RepID=UPI0035EB11BD
MMASLPDQASVKSAWKNNQVKVTCLVVCYNHKNYIFECLKSIVSQKSDFAFKVVVYDDFSTDGTREILKAFEERYPDIMDVYYAEYNHYGIAQKEEHLDKLEGDYIAMCEGDDYWLDNSKLKKQYEETTRRKAFFCVHPAIIFSQENNSEDVFCYYGNKVRILPQKLIFGLKNQFAPTASYFIKMDKYLEYTQFRKKLKGGPGDFFMEVLASDKGVVYIPDIMAAYRRGNVGSHSHRQTVASEIDVNNDLERWSSNLGLLLESRPHLEKHMMKKRTLVEIDCLLRVHGIVDKRYGKEKSEEYMNKAGQLLKGLGPIEY